MALSGARRVCFAFAIAAAIANLGAPQAWAQDDKSPANQTTADNKCPRSVQPGDAPSGQRQQMLMNYEAGDFPIEGDPAEAQYLERLNQKLLRLGIEIDRGFAPVRKNRMRTEMRVWATSETRQWVARVQGYFVHKINVHADPDQRQSVVIAFWKSDRDVAPTRAALNALLDRIGIHVIAEPAVRRDLASEQQGAILWAQAEATLREAQSLELTRLLNFVADPRIEAFGNPIP